MPTPKTTLPDLQIQHINCRACIDYLTVVVQDKRPSILPVLNGLPKWHKVRGANHWELTVHDPSYRDVVRLAETLGNPMLYKMELAVDLFPKITIPVSEREEFLRQTFVAVAARFRPEDMTAWGYGPRGGLTGPGQKPMPFHQRLPNPDEELIYGRKGEFLQSKMYLKRVDQGLSIPAVQHRVRMELTLKRHALQVVQLGQLQDLFSYPFRSTFTKHFRIVSGARVKVVRGLDEMAHVKLEKKMNRAWNTAGVGKFAVHTALPFETNDFAVKAIKARAKRQLSSEEFVLTRHQEANAKIGDAFKKLQLRMTT